MPRKAPDLAQLARTLKAPSFSHAAASADRAVLEPVSPTTLVLRVDEIKAYEHNPRHAENREYPRLKDSIRARRGLTTPLTVTKRPGDDLYTIAAGGNSRLRALKELVEETQDEVFASVTCRFEPWDSECQTFANHLIENDIRGTMTFGDKARAILDWQRLYEANHPEEGRLTQRRLADCLAAAGYTVPRSLVTRWLETAELLLPHLPIAFGSGLGRPAAERLLRLRMCCAQYWNENAATKSPNTDCAFDDLFAHVSAQRDRHCADWDHELFQSALTSQVASALGLDRKRVALDIDSLYHGCAVELAETEVTRSPLERDPQGLKSEWAFARAREVDAAKKARAMARIGARAGATIEQAHDHHESASTPVGDASAPTARRDPRQEVRALRDRNYAAAHRLAAGHALDPFLRSVEIGLGFFIEAPEPSAVPTQSKDAATLPGEGLVLNGIRSGLWWLLCLTADQLVPARIGALGRVAPASWFVELMSGLPKRSPETDPVAALHLLVGEPTAQGLVSEVLMNPGFAGEDLAAFNELLRGCRALCALAEHDGEELWGIKS
jgi:ParB family protein of integrating conjugative element (PFGI_1 class)